jgi:hypothetical protein
MTPARRGWHPAVPVAVAVASLSICAGVAFAGGGGVTPPDPPKVTDVVCISTCGGIHKATAGSKVQLSGRHLKHVTQVRSRRRRRPDRGRPDRRRQPSVKVGTRWRGARQAEQTDSYRSATSPTTLKIVAASQIGPPGTLSSGGLREAAQVLLLRQQEADHDVHVHEHRATDVRIDVVKQPEGRSSTAGSSRPKSRTRATPSNGAEPTQQAGFQRHLPVPYWPQVRQHEIHHRLQVPIPPLQVPGSGLTATGTGSAPRGPATSTRDGRHGSMRHPAAGPRRPGAVEGLPGERRRLLPGDRRQEDRARLDVCTQEAVPPPQGAGGAPGNGSASWARPVPPAAISTSRSGRRRAGTSGHFLGRSPGT